ncbi:MAG: DMT family transporter [Chloroflexi bacterium]|nr:DMT family transporter [Chloroflexota bacterium]
MPLGELSAMASALLWALNGVLLKPVTARLPALRITSLQYLFAAAFFLAVALPLGKADGVSQIPWAQAAGLVAGAFIGMAGGDTSYIRSLGLLGVARSFPLSTAGYILLAFLFAAVFLGEPVTWESVLGAVALLGGIWLVVRASGSAIDAADKLTPEATRQGLLYAGIAALCWAVTTTILKLALEGIDVLSANIIRIPLVALVLTGAAWRVYGIDLAAYDRRTVLVSALAGMLGIGVGSIFFLYAIQEAGAAKTAVLSSTSPLFAAVLAVAFLGERVSGALALGTLLSVVGVWLVV